MRQIAKEFNFSKEGEGNIMKKALVLGASGGMGYSLVKELSSRGIKVVAFARTKEKLERLFHDDANVMIFAGDVFNKRDLAEEQKALILYFMVQIFLIGSLLCDCS